MSPTMVLGARSTSQTLTGSLNVSIKSHIITGAICFVLGAGVVGGFVYRYSSGRIAEIGGQLEQARSANRDIANRLVQREVVVNQLAESISERQGVIDSARRELESSKSSIAKIRAILEHLKALELYRNSYGAREHYDTGIDPN